MLRSIAKIHGKNLFNCAGKKLQVHSIEALIGHQLQEFKKELSEAFMGITKTY